MVTAPRRRTDVPKAGDIVWLECDPQAGHEQAGRRPAVILSPASHNGRIGLAVVCPVTARITRYPFEVALAGDRPSVALAGQVRIFDWRVRCARFKARATAPELREIQGKLRALIG